MSASEHVTKSLDVACPFCGAPVGESCGTNGNVTRNLPVKPHKKREQAANELRMKLAEVREIKGEGMR